jgi:hypothetical protein
MSAAIQYALLDALAVELGWTEWRPEDWPYLVAEVAELVRLREQAAEVVDADDRIHQELGRARPARTARALVSDE